jgi:hypothetical protein
MKKIILVIFIIIIMSQIHTIAGEETFNTVDSGPIEYVHQKVAWKPDGSYALIVGRNGDLLKYDGSTCTTIETDAGNLYDADWQPDGKYATIVGSGGIILKYDGSNLITEESTISDTYFSVDWKSDGSYALIVGENGLYKYRSGNPVNQLSTLYYGKCVAWSPIEDIALVASNEGIYTYYDYGSNNYDLTLTYSDWTGYIFGISWKSNGDFALIVGDDVENKIVKYDGTSFIELSIDGDYWFNDIAWKPTDNYALLVGQYGIVIKHDGNSYKEISSPTDKELNGIDWKPNSDIALIVGGNQLRTIGGIIIECESKEDLPKPPNGNGNHAPIINSITVNPTIIKPNEKCTIKVDASDEDINDILSYKYSIEIGTIEGSGSVVTWTAPGSDGTYTLNVTVSDGFDSVSKSIIITVRNNENNKINDENNQDGDKEESDSNSSPGFDGIALIITFVAIILILSKEKINKKIN